MLGTHVKSIARYSPFGNAAVTVCKTSLSICVNPALNRLLSSDGENLTCAPSKRSKKKRRCCKYC